MALADTYADLDGHIEGLYRGQLVAEEDVRRLCEKVKEILQAESNVVPVRAPVTVVSALSRRRETHCALLGLQRAFLHPPCPAGRVGLSLPTCGSRLCPKTTHCAFPGG